MKLHSIFALLLLFVFGCATIDSTMSNRGVFNEKTSKMDGRRIVTMSPVLSKHGLTDIQAEFGLYWDTAMGEAALFIVELVGAVSFDPEKPFEIKVDGALFELLPASPYDYGDINTYYGETYVPAHNKSRKSYIVHKDQILKIANGKEAYYRINFLKNRSAEGEISYQYKEYQSYVPYSFRKFHSQVW